MDAPTVMPTGALKVVCTGSHTVSYMHRTRKLTSTSSTYQSRKQINGYSDISHAHSHQHRARNTEVTHTQLTRNTLTAKNATMRMMASMNRYTSQEVVSQIGNMMSTQLAMDDTTITFTKAQGKVSKFITP